MSNPLTVEPLALAAQTASGSGSSLDITALRSVLDLEVRVDAVAGTLPTLKVIVETSGATGGPWREVGRLDETIDSTADVGVYKLLAGGCARYVRLRWEITGTGSPSFTFGVSGNAHVVYATRDDLTKYGMSRNVLDDIEQELILDNILTASGEADDYLRVAYDLPLASFGRSLTKHVSIMAVYGIATGPNREGADEMLRETWEDTIKWFKDIGSGRIRPDTIVDDTPSVEEDGAFVTSQASRGWV